MTKDLREIMTEQFRNTFIEILRSQFRSHPKLSIQFFSSPSVRQKDIDKGIVEVSHEMSQTLVKKLEERGYLEREPSEAELNQLISQVLKEFGVQNE